MVYLVSMSATCSTSHLMTAWSDGTRFPKRASRAILWTRNKSSTDCTVRSARELLADSPTAEFSGTIVPLRPDLRIACSMTAHMELSWSLLTTKLKLFSPDSRMNEATLVTP